MQTKNYSFFFHLIFFSNLIDSNPAFNDELDKQLFKDVKIPYANDICRSLEIFGDITAGAGRCVLFINNLTAKLKAFENFLCIRYCCFTYKFSLTLGNAADLFWGIHLFLRQYEKDEKVEPNPSSKDKKVVPIPNQCNPNHIENLEIFVNNQNSKLCV